MLVLNTTHETAATDELDELVVSDDQRRRSRFRATTEDGQTVGVVRDGEDPLQAGDVLGTDEEPIAVVSLESTTAAVLDVAALEATTDQLLAFTELGHALGNRHRKLAVRGTEILVPVTDGRERLEGELRPHLPDGVSIAYESVDPEVFDDDAPGHGGDHSHGEGHGHSHERHADHTHGEGHGHTHQEGHGHAHEERDGSDAGDGHSERDTDEEFDIDIVPDGGRRQAAGRANREGQR